MTRKFNYTHLRIFDKNGIEIPLNFDAYCKIEFPNKYGENSIFYPVTDVSSNIIDYYKKFSGNRYLANEIENGQANFIGYIDETPISGTASVLYSETINNLSQEESSYKEYTINNIDTATIISKSLGYPSITFNTKLAFDEVSTDLVETQTLYILAEKKKALNPNETSDNTIDKVSECTTTSALNWRNRYKLLFFIDNRDQTNFRFFTVSNDEVVWTDKIILDLSNSNDYKVNIGFTSTEEGNYEQSMYVCVLDKGASFNKSDEEADIYPIGQITLTAESIGEDERYRTLFTNFGIPDPIKYHNVFNNVDSLEDNVDWRILNENSKKLFLSYSEIFPYAGSYKGLLNAIKVLGYEDILFKEWYKNLGQTTSNNTYIAYDMTYGSDRNANIISNLSVEEKIQLKKLNWLSMMYKINEETSSAVDKYGFPEVVNKYGYNDNSFIVKLIALREWLQKYIVGLNCRIIDIGGEGIYFERYRLASFATHQQVLEWNNEKNLTPFVITDNDYTLKNNECDININVGTEDLYLTLEDIKGKTIVDFCEGYIDSSNYYHIFNISNYDPSANYIYTGQTLESISDFKTFEIKASSKTDSFIFNDSFLDTSSCTLLVYDNRLQVNPYDISKNVNGCDAVFKVLPTIYLENGTIESGNTIYKIEVSTSEGSYVLTLPDDSSILYNDYVTLIPSSSNSAFDYGFDEELNNYVIHIKDYKILNKDSSILITGTYVLYIIDGKCAFNDYEYDREVYLNFNYDLNVQEQNISVNTIYHSDEFTTKYYNTSKSDIFYHLIPGNLYTDFVNYYKKCLKDDSEGAVNYDFVHSITVNNSGTFTIDVYAKDIHNNIFAKACTEYAYVGMPSIKLNTYTLDASSNNEFDEAGTKLTASEKYQDISSPFIEYCIFDNSDLNDIIEISNNEEIGYIKYSNESYNTNAGDDTQYVDLINLTDKFYPTDISVFMSTEGTGSNLYKGYYMLLDSYKCKNIYLSYDNKLAMREETGDPLYDPSNPGEYVSVLNKILNNVNRPEYSNVQLIIFNDLGKYPILQVPGIMYKCPSGQFALCINDTSKSSYAWQKNTNSTDLISSVINGDKMTAIRHGKDARYYVKTNKNFDGVTDSCILNSADNVLPDITYLLQNKNAYISFFIIPTWKVQVKLRISNDIPIVQTFSNEFPLNFVNGSLIKLIYQSKQLPYKTQSSHKILYADNISQEYKLSGTINPEYAIKIGNYIVTPLPEDDQSSPLHDIHEELKRKSPSPTVGAQTEICEYGEDVPTLTCIYLVDSEGNRKWTVVTRRKNESGEYESVYGPNVDDSNMIELYISPDVHAYVDYKLTGINISENNSNESIIKINQTNKSRKILDFIDSSTFGLNTKNYDINNGIKYWMDSYFTEAKPNVLHPNIVKDGKNIYRYNSCPVSVYADNNNTVIEVNYANSNIDQESSYVLWKVYKSIDNNKTLLFESYNPKLYLDISDKGLYDIVVNIFDKHGNLSVNTFRGQLKII